MRSDCTNKVGNLISIACKQREMDPVLLIRNHAFATFHDRICSVYSRLVPRRYRTSLEHGLLSCVRWWAGANGSPTALDPEIVHHLPQATSSSKLMSLVMIWVTGCRSVSNVHVSVRVCGVPSSDSSDWGLSPPLYFCYVTKVQFLGNLV